MKIKNSAICLLFLYTPALAIAQNSTQFLSLEAYGASNTLGICYDRRIIGNDGWGVRTSVGWGYVKAGALDATYSFSIPLEVNYLLGKKKHFLELGFGANFGIYHQDNTQLDDYHATDYTSKTENRFGYFIFSDIGYRYQRPSGIILRFGLTPNFNFGDKFGIEKFWFCPFLGVGWSF